MTDLPDDIISDYPVRSPDPRYVICWTLIIPSIVGLVPLYAWLLGWFIATNWRWLP